MDDDIASTAERDVLYAIIATLLLCLVVLWTNTGKAEKSEENEATRPPGNVLVEANWPPEIDADVDLWVQAPGDVPVGHSNKGGRVFNLLRDDLGRFSDLSGINFENSYARGIVPGEYTVNLHLYRNRSAGSVPVRSSLGQALSHRAGHSDRQSYRAGRRLAVSEGHQRYPSASCFSFRLVSDQSLIGAGVASVRRKSPRL